MNKILAAILVLGLGATAHAQSWVGSTSIGLGVATGPLAWDSPGVHLSDAVLSPALSLEAFLGALLEGDAAVGLQFAASVVTNSDTYLSYTKFKEGYEVGTTIHAAIRTRGGKRIWRFGAGAETAGFGTDGVDVGAPGNVAEGEMMVGPIAEVSYGWLLSESFGVSLEVRAGYLFSEHLRYVPISLLARIELGAY